MASTKKLLEAYRQVNKEFRHEYNGETWDVWLYKDNNTGGHPDLSGLLTSQLDTLLTNKLREHAVRLQEEAEKKNAEAMHIFSLINH